MSFEDRFVDRLRLLYAEDIEGKGLIDQAESTINKYVANFGQKVEDFESATYGDIQVFSDYPKDELFSEIRIKGNILGFKRIKNSIEVYKIIGDDRERIDTIYPSLSDEACKRRQGGYFNDYAFDDYLEIVFKEIIS